MDYRTYAILVLVIAFVVTPAAMILADAWSRRND